MMDDHRGILYALAAAVLWSTVGVAAKVAVSSINFFVAALYTGVFATGILFVLLVVRGRAGRILPQFIKQPGLFVCAGVAGFGLQQVFYMQAYALQPASDTVVIIYLWPLLTILLAAILLKEPTSWRSTLLVISGFAGVCVLKSNGGLLRVHFTVGTLYAFLAGLSWAVFSVLVKRRKFDTDVGMLLFNLFGVLLLAALIPFRTFNGHITPLQGSILLYLAVFTVVLPATLWNKALHLTRTSICANIALLVPVIGTILIVLILREPVRASLVLGMILVVGSAFVALHPGRIGK